MVKSRGLHVVYTARKGADGFYDVSHVVDSTASRPEWVFEETNLGAPSLKEVVGRLLKYWPGYKLYKRWDRSYLIWVILLERVESGG